MRDSETRLSLIRRNDSMVARRDITQEHLFWKSLRFFPAAKPSFSAGLFVFGPWRGGLAFGGLQIVAALSANVQDDGEYRWVWPAKGSIFQIPEKGAWMPICDESVWPQGGIIFLAENFFFFFSLQGPFIIIKNKWNMVLIKTACWLNNLRNFKNIL